MALAARPVVNTLDDDTFITRGGKSSGATINYAGYVAATDVRSHASIDCDQRALEDCYDNYAGSDYFDGTYSDMFTCAEAIYRTGQAAGTCNLKSSRTLRVCMQPRRDTRPSSSARLPICAVSQSPTRAYAHG